MTITLRPSLIGRVRMMGPAAIIAPPFLVATAITVALRPVEWVTWAYLIEAALAVIATISVVIRYRLAVGPDAVDVQTGLGHRIRVPLAEIRSAVIAPGIRTRFGTRPQLRVAGRSNGLVLRAPAWSPTELDRVADALRTAGVEVTTDRATSVDELRHRYAGMDEQLPLPADARRATIVGVAALAAGFVGFCVLLAVLIGTRR